MRMRSSSIVSVAFVRRWNLDSAGFALKDDFESARKIDARTRRYSDVAVWTMAGGILLIMLVGVVRLFAVL